MVKLAKWNYILAPLLPIGVSLWLLGPGSFINQALAVVVVAILTVVAAGWLAEKNYPEFESQRFNALFNEEEYVAMGIAADVISNRNKEYSREQVANALLSAIWGGEFEYDLDSSFLFLPISRGVRLTGGEWAPTNRDGDVLAQAPLHPLRRRDLLVAMKPSLPLDLPSNKEIGGMSDNELIEKSYFDVLASLKPSQYGTEHCGLDVYFENLFVPREMFARWFVRWKEGKYGADSVERAPYSAVADPIVRQTKWKFESWDGVDPLTMAQAASLWAGVDPGRGPSQAKAQYKILAQAINNKALSPMPVSLRVALKLRNGGAEQAPDIEISRNELRRFIDEQKMRPAPFLFPEDR